MKDALSLWRAPLDQVAIAEAEALSNRQPQCSIVYGEDFSAMTVYNFGYFISSGSSPTTALTAMFAAMNPSSQGAVGGLAFIPQQSFAVSPQQAGFSVPDQCRIIGSGGGGAAVSGSTPFYHFVVTPNLAGATTFLNCNSNLTTGGICFTSLAFQWAASSNATDTCISAAAWNVRAIRCTFTDCPLAFSASGVSCTLEQCTIDYTVSAPTSARAIVISGQQCAVRGPSVFSQAQTAAACTCISLQGAQHPVIADVQMLGWSIGVDFSAIGGTLNSEITNCEIECLQMALNIALPTGGPPTTGVKVTSCVLTKSSNSTGASPIVAINANGGTLADVTLTDCTVFNMAVANSAQTGLTIASGSNIKVLGGTYSNNGSVGGAGIAITGAATDVQIIGANLQPSYANPGNVNAQQYGLLISGNPTNVLVTDCDMTGYRSGSGNPVHVTGSPSTLRIARCAGYNDVGTSLVANYAQLITGVDAASIAAPYYGPSVLIYFGSASVTLHIFGQSIAGSMGIVFLPSAYDRFWFTPTPPSTLVWIGK